MAKGPGLDVRSPEVAQVIAGLEAAQLRLNKELRIEHDSIAKFAAGKFNARSAATPGFRDWRQAWRGNGLQRGAQITLRSSGAFAGSKSIFLGRKPNTRSGWNASRYDAFGIRIGGRRRLPGSKPQARPWVGSSWIVGLPNEGPYIVRDVAPAITGQVSDRLYAAFGRASNRVWKGKL